MPCFFPPLPFQPLTTKYQACTQPKYRPNKRVINSSAVLGQAKFIHPCVAEHSRLQDFKAQGSTTKHQAPSLKHCTSWLDTTPRLVQCPVPEFPCRRSKTVRSKDPWTLRCPVVISLVSSPTPIPILILLCFFVLGVIASGTEASYHPLITRI
jgi:hypothetical protein